MIQDLRGKFDIPFDELYHKEKKLVEAVIEAEKQFKLKQSSLTSPLQPDLLDPRIIEFARKKNIESLLPADVFEQNEIR